ncbi:hypothetical protein [Erythrobacter colymbi]|uniref:hypothetical protein n=1 Tax=Erythrobacter colymbi TaxID=1161202 RepID=UPI000A36E971|nr:hypothetical protein [Erythrobacter colymbi]
MIRPTIRPAALPALAAATALWLAPPVPLAAQQTFELPPASPSPTPAPAGPSDERAGIAIPPRTAPGATPTATPSAAPSATSTPVIQPLPAPSASRAPAPRPASPAPAAAPSTAAANAAAAPDAAAPTTLPSGTADAPAPSILSGAPPLAGTPATDASATDALAALPAWWPYAAGGLGALALLGGGVMLARRRKPKALRLAAPVAGSAPASAPVIDEAPRLDMVLEITSATRSVMMFTVEYRLTIANRSGRAVNDARTAVQLACARASAGNAPSAGSAQGLAELERIGPHQARSVSGTVQLPLSAIAPLRQGQTPLFIPLAHVTLEAEGVPAQARSFVIGTPSAAGRVHPIALDVPPGAIAGLVAQAVAIPPVGAAA